ncbi:MAG TPA: hypothetical protein VKP52_11940 [Pseudolabrys sp.]|jgi:hypothetical protein|nr:hypothetical protein [Pseudolabrys sp.]
MSKIAKHLAFIGLVFAMNAGVSIPASAEPSCDSRVPHASNCPVDLAAQKKRPRVTIYPRRIYPGPNAKRQCRSWLVEEYRVSGPVIVPQMRCWWE